MSRLFDDRPDEVPGSFPGDTRAPAAELAEAGFDSPELYQAVRETWMLLQGKSRTLRALALLLAFKHGYTARVRHGSSPMSGGKLTMQHSFIVIMIGQHQVIVDPAFRDQFELGLFDYEYESFLRSEVPGLFVGTCELMASMVHVVCQMMGEALGRLQLAAPPWRRLEAIRSKWAPPRFRDERFGPYATKSIAVAAALQAAAGSSTTSPEPLSGLAGTRGPVTSAGCGRPCLEPRLKVVGFDLRAQRPAGAEAAAGPAPQDLLHSVSAAVAALDGVCSSPPASFVRSLSDRACHAAAAGQGAAGGPRALKA